MWDLPRPGLEPVSPALAGRFSTTAPPGKPLRLFFYDEDQHKAKNRESSQNKQLLHEQLLFTQTKPINLPMRNLFLPWKLSMMEKNFINITSKLIAQKSKLDLVVIQRLFFSVNTLTLIRNKSCFLDLKCRIKFVANISGNSSWRTAISPNNSSSPLKLLYFEKSPKHFFLYYKQYRTMPNYGKIIFRLVNYSETF